MEKRIILGTAGHVDHGKTALVRRMTGVNTDRLKEEQTRGITIELGFAPFDLPDGQRIGIVDVPGHEKFIRTMRRCFYKNMFVNNRFVHLFFFLACKCTHLFLNTKIL